MGDNQMTRRDINHRQWLISAVIFACADPTRTHEEIADCIIDKMVADAIKRERERKTYQEETT
jgi:hypothetical protein